MRKLNPPHLTSNNFDKSIPGKKNNPVEEVKDKEKNGEKAKKE